MNKINKVLFILMLVIAVSVIGNQAYAQPTISGGSGGSQPGFSGGPLGGPLTDTPDVPFDGGLSLVLLAAGAGYGSKKVKKTSPVVG